MHGLDEAARDREAKAGAGADMIALLRAIELVEHALELGGRNAVALVDDLRARPDAVSARLRIEIVVSAGEYFAALSSRLNSTCSNSTASSSQHRQVGGELERDLVMREDLAGAPQRAADDLADIVQRRVRHDRAGFQLGHVEQIGDEAVEPLGLVDHGRQQIALLLYRTVHWRDRAWSRRRPARRPAAS